MTDTSEDQRRSAEAEALARLKEELARRKAAG